VLSTIEVDGGEVTRDLEEQLLAVDVDRLVHGSTVTGEAQDPLKPLSMLKDSRRTLPGRTIVTGGADGTVRTYDCEICGDLGEPVQLAERRLAATRRELTPGERARYLG
jgi:hypothetical protein